MRIIAMGEKALTEGFALLGAETHPDATPEEVEQVLSGLIRQQAKALVFIEHDLARSHIPSLDLVRREGGRIVISEVPPLHTPSDYHPPVEDLVMRVLGPSALEDRT